MILNSDDHISHDQKNRREQRFLQEILDNKNEQIEETKWTVGHYEREMKREDRSGAELLWGWHER